MLRVSEINNIHLRHLSTDHLAKKIHKLAFSSFCQNFNNKNSKKKKTTIYNFTVVTSLVNGSKFVFILLLYFSLIVGTSFLKRIMYVIILYKPFTIFLF